MANEFGQNERIIRLKVLQLNGLPGLRLIKRYLVFWLVAWSVQWRSPVTGYALYTSPPEKKRRAQRCHQMNRTGPFRLVLGRRRVRPYGFRMSELG